MEKTFEIEKSNIQDKTSEYKNLSKGLYKEASELAKKHFLFSDKMLAEVKAEVSKCLATNCEYNAYRHCLAAEIWIQEMRNS